MSKFRLLFFVYSTFILFSSPILSQSTGKIAGKITDESTGEVIPFANVFVEGTTLGAAADENGIYTIVNVPPGVYNITASVVGYQKVTVENIRVNVDFTTRQNFKLSSGTVDLPPVIVQGERNPLIRQDLTNPTVAITDESIQELPVDQISDVIGLQAGVVRGDDGSLHVRGGYSNEVSYTLNGVALNDPYDNTRSIGLATNAVKEVSVSTGTFAAQYGNALSGVVNYVTKEGSDNYSFSLRGYGGDYATDRTSLFTDKLGYKEIDPVNRGRMEGTFGGPLPFLNKAKFYISSIYENFKGSRYGVRIYEPTDSYLSPDNFRSSDPRAGSSTDPLYFNPYYNTTNGLPTGDSAIVPMNTFENFNLQGNLSYKFGSLIKVKYEAVYNKGVGDGRSGLSFGFSDNERAYMFNPDGRGQTHSIGLIQTLDLTHTLSSNIFYTLTGSYGYDQNQYYLYKDINDPRYLPALFRNEIGTTGFYAGGTDNYREYRKTTTYGVKGDLVAQLFNIHEFKFGFEYRKHELNFDSYSIEFGKIENGVFNSNIINNDLLYDSTLHLARRIPGDQSLHTIYNVKPTQFSTYLQDKIELASTFIVNAGLRYEYFDPATTYNPDISKNLTDSINGNITAYNVPADKQNMLSPRISVSYPITDRGIIRFSYGHFYQIGSLQSLYRNLNYYVTNAGESPTFGNANVKPQRSVQYEIGLQQQLTDDFKFDLTGFYKDVTNYIYSQTIYTAKGREYNVLTNLAYANTRGITLSFFKRRSPGGIFQASLDYTFSIAEGNRTEPSAEIFLSEVSGKETETFLVPLSFDRSHVINGTVALIPDDNWNIGLLFNLQTGAPYTPSLPSQLQSVRYVQYSGNKLTQWNVDLKVERFFEIGPFRTSLFLQVQNLFDTQNENSVWASSGRALSNVEQVLNSSFEFRDTRMRIERGDPGLFGENVLNNYYSDRPERVSRPREIRLGFSLLFN